MSQCVHLISCLDPLRYLFDRPALVGHLMRWLVLLTEFDIHYVTQKSVRGSFVTDHLASLPVSDGRVITTQKVLFYTFNSLCFKHFCVVVLHL